MEKMSAAFSDIMVMTRRNVIRYIRLPQLLVFNAMLNVVLLLLFNYVFGGAIQKSGVAYIQYFLPGFLAQTVVFGSTQTSVGIAEDLSKGLIDRFRSLPMARPAFLTGRVIADGIRYALLIVLMIGVGVAAGFRFENGLLPAIGRLFTRYSLRYRADLGRCLYRDIGQESGNGAGRRFCLGFSPGFCQFSLCPDCHYAGLAAVLC